MSHTDQNSRSSAVVVSIVRLTYVVALQTGRDEAESFVDTFINAMMWTSIEVSISTITGT